jgi:hypothetical protein
MRRRGGLDAAHRPLADARRRVLQAIEVAGDEPLAGPAILLRVSDPAAEAKTRGGPGADRAGSPDDQALLYPALHSLEADWGLKTAWLPDADGVPHRTYTKRCLLPCRLGR